MKITDQNYEACALDYLEGTLAAADRRAFERFLAENPVIAEQVRALQADLPRLAPDLSVRFGNKASLKRKAPVRMLYLRIASAAAVLLAGVLVFNALHQDRTAEQPAAPLLADAVPAPVPTTIAPQPESLGTPLAVPESPIRLQSAHTSTVPRKTAAPQTIETQQPLSDEAGQPEAAAEPAHEVLAMTPIAAGVPLKTLAQTRRPAVERVVSVTRGYVLERTNEPVLPAENEPEPGDRQLSVQAGFLNVLSPRGFRSLASRVITPLSEVSPISVHENSEERIVEFASIPILRKNKRQFENQ